MRFAARVVVEALALMGIVLLSQGSLWALIALGGLLGVCGLVLSAGERS